MGWKADMANSRTKRQPWKLWQFSAMTIEHTVPGAVLLGLGCACESRCRRLKLKNTGCADMDPDLDTGAGIRQMIFFCNIFLYYKFNISNNKYF